MGERTYLVQTLIDGEVYASLHTPGEIISRIDMQDCSNEQIYVYDISKFGKVTRLKVYGTWHDCKKPLYIKITTARGKIVFDGHGTDH